MTKGSAFLSNRKSTALPVLFCLLLSAFSTGAVYGAAPTVNISGAPAAVNSIAPFDVTVVFSEFVTEFIDMDVVVGNGSVSSFSSLDGISYAVEITPTVAGDIAIDIPAGVAENLTFEDNIASAPVTVAFDDTAPTVEIQNAPVTTNATAFDITVVFSEAVTGFEVADVSVTNGTATDITGSGTTYTVQVTPSGGGDISIDILAGVTQDAGTNGNVAALQVNVIYDATPPDVDIQGEPATISSNTPFEVTIQFSEPVTGFESGDVVLSNALISNFTVVDEDTYTVEITLNNAADISIDIPSDVAQDVAMSGNIAATQAIVVFVNVVPIANAGNDQDADEGRGFDLDGTGSAATSPDLFNVYEWTQILGPTVTLTAADTATPNFRAPYVISDTLLQFELVVTGGFGGSSTTDRVDITVLNAVAPDAGVDQQVTEGETVRLNGINSLSIRNSISSYRWTQTDGPFVVLSSDVIATPSFDAPEVVADGDNTLLVFDLVATDSAGASDLATVFINVRDQLLTTTVPPLDIRLVTNSVSEGVIYQFDLLDGPIVGSVDVLWYQLLYGPDISLDSADPALPTFIAPALPADASAGFEVRSTDINGLVTRADVNVNILGTGSTNEVPVADAGIDQLVNEGDTVDLDASGSTDDGSIVGYYWRQTGGPGAVLASIIQGRTSFVAPPIAPADSGVELTFEVMVLDDAGFVDRQSVSIAVEDNGIIEFADDVTKISSAFGDPVAIVTDGGSLISLYALNPAVIVDVANRPDSFPFGLFDFGLRVEPGSTVQVSFVLPQPVGDEMTWWKYTNDGGWVDYSARTSFNATRDVVTITLMDNGFGDDDPLPGIIRDPGGIAPRTPEAAEPVAPKAASSGGGGGTAEPYLLMLLLFAACAAVSRSILRRRLNRLN